MKESEIKYPQDDQEWGETSFKEKQQKGKNPTTDERSLLARHCVRGYAYVS